MSISTMPADLRAALTGWQALLAAYAGGALLALGFAPTSYVLVIFLSLPLLFVLLRDAPRGTMAAWRAFFFGYGFFTAGTWWIANSMLVDAGKFAWMIPFSIFGLSAVLALWFAGLGALVYRFRTGRAGVDVLRFAVLWVAIEYLRSLGLFGFPWNLLGYVTLASLPLAQGAAYIGTYGLSFIVVLTALLPVLTALRGRTVWRGLLMVLILVSGLYGAGKQRLLEPLQNATGVPQGAATTNVMLRVVQPNIPQSLKGTQDGQAMAIDVLRAFSRAPHPGATAPEVTVWPETAYPFTVRGDQDAFMMPTSGTLITGAVRAEASGPQGLMIWNSVLAMDAAGHVLNIYDKHQLVPFGEFVPLRSVLPLDKITPGNIDFTRGDGIHTVTLPGVPSYSPLVCYEVIFPWLAADDTQRPHWLVNVTNDGWYGDSPGPYQHFAMARMRAIEQGLPLVRAANSGISAIIGPKGQVISQLGLNTRGALEAALPAAARPTVYARFGELPAVTLLIIAWIMSMLPFCLSKHK